MLSLRFAFSIVLTPHAIEPNTLLYNLLFLLYFFKCELCSQNDDKMMFVNLQEYLLYGIGSFLDIPDLVCILMTCKNFHYIFDCDDIWRKRERSGRFPKRLIRCINTIRDRSTSRRMTEVKLNYIQWWICSMHNNDMIQQNIFLDNYNIHLRNDLRLSVAQTITSSINRKILAGNQTQVNCLHQRILFIFSKYIYQNRRNLDHSIWLHINCSQCLQQCYGSVWFCCSCKEYVCTNCSDGKHIKPGHPMHPFILQQPPEKGLDFNSAYVCGCFDCGITIHIQARSACSSNTKQSYTHHNNSSNMGKNKERIVKGRKSSLVSVDFVCAGVDGLFRQRCRTVAGQTDLLSRLRTEIDFLLTADDAPG